jgi:hypothetical protein
MWGTKPSRSWVWPRARKESTRLPIAPAALARNAESGILAGTFVDRNIAN